MLSTHALNNAVAGELRARASKRGLTGAALARTVDLPSIYVQRRLSGVVEISVADLFILCDGLDVAPLDVIAQVMSETGTGVPSPTH